MQFSKPTSRWALWVFAAALLLKSALPFLASASAQLQGKALVEVCTVYGVALVPQAGDKHDLPADHALASGGDHCVLTALTALASADPPVLGPLALASDSAAPLDAHPSSLAHDAAAAWVARRKHGPPGLS